MLTLLVFATVFGAESDRSTAQTVEWLVREGRNAELNRMLAEGLDIIGLSKVPKSPCCDPPTPLAWAARAGNIEAAKLFLQRGVPIDVPGTDNPLHLAVETEHVDFVEWLLVHHATINLQDASGRTPLLIAVCRGSARLVQLLLDKGAALNLQASEGNSPLRCALGDTTLLKYLLAHGANPNLVDRSGKTALHSIAEDVAYSSVQDICPREGHLVEVAEALLARGAHADVSDAQGQTPLMLAAAKGCSAMVALLLDHEAKVSRRDTHGRSALHRAAAEGHPAVVQLLLNRGASADERDHLGWSALHHAAYGRFEWFNYCLASNAMRQIPQSRPAYLVVVQLLLRHRDLRNAIAFDGSTPEVLARRQQAIAASFGTETCFGIKVVSHDFANVLSTLANWWMQ